MRRLAAKLMLLCLCVAGALGIGELAARVLWKWQYNRFLAAQLGGYQVLDAERSIALLKPGTSYTCAAFVELLKKNGKSMGAGLLEADARARHILPSDRIFEVNSHGLAGPEVSKVKPPATIRILALGDSVTFGPYVTEQSYPRVVERELSRMTVNGIARFEVLNGGVQGYNIESVLKRIDDLLPLQPDVITVLIGWNRTILRADPDKNERLYRVLASYRLLYHALEGRSSTQHVPGAAQNVYNPSDPLVPRLRQTTFTSDFEDWHSLVAKIRRTLPKSRVVVLTLPGLFIEGYRPDALARQIAFSVAFSPNLHAWEVLAEVYNRKLREMARAEKLDLIDLAEWSKAALQPRSTYFADSVHLTTEGYAIMGRHLARELARTMGWRITPVEDAPPVLAARTIEGSRP